MPLNMATIREALCTRIKNGTTRKVRGYPYVVGAIHELPGVLIRSDDDYINYHVTQGLEADIRLVLDVMMHCRTSHEEGLRMLDELLSREAGVPHSVIDAIEADRTLGGVVVETVVGLAGPQVGFGQVEEGRPEGVMVSVPIEIWSVQT